MRCLILGCLAFVTGCGSLRAPRQAPEVPVPAAWSVVTEAPITQPETWWKNFDDPQLDAVVDQALRANNDFAAAAIRVRRAQLQAGLVDTNRSPAVAVGAGVAGTHTFDPPATTHSGGVSAALSFEVDLWGKLASQRDAAHWEAQATEADCQSFALTLVGSTTHLYWQLAYLNQLLTLSAGDIDYAQQTLALTRAKYAAGALSALNTAQAELDLATQEAVRTQLVQQRVETRNALATLLNQPPGSDVAELSELSNAPMPPVEAGIPAEILANRPDLQAAELRLRESMANVDFTRASFYPSFTLTGSLGTASTTLVNLLRNPIATLGAGLSLPFVQWNTMQLSIRVSETQYEEAVVNYRQRLYTALAEVENSLSARTQLLAEEGKLRLAVTHARRAESIAQFRFKSGATDLQQWLYAQTGLRNAERALVLNRLNQLNNMVSLYKSLGLGARAEPISCAQLAASQ